MRLLDLITGSRAFVASVLLVTALASTVVLFPASATAQTEPVPPRKFQMLVLGDSIPWGQGLEDDKKYSTIVKNEIARRLGRDVNVVNKAHSGATIKPKDKSSLIEPGEVPLYTPTLWQQLNAAVADYKCEERSSPNDKGSPPKYRCSGVDLVLLDGGINDIGILKIVGPFSSEQSIRRGSHKYCYMEMKAFLDEVLATFENATVVVTGYYPIVSSGMGGTDPDTIRDLFRSYLGLAKSDEKKVEKAAKRDHDWYIDILARRSAFWKKASDDDLSASVDAANRTAGTSRAMFVKVDFAPTECYAAKDTKLFRLIGFDANRNPLTDDNWFNERVEMLCPKAKRDINSSTIGLFSRIYLTSICKPAAAGHPNERGAQKYADAILTDLVPRLVKMEPSGSAGSYRQY